MTLSKLEGDFIFNKMYAIIKSGDVSTNSFLIMIECQDLLKARKRWPDELNDNMVVKKWYLRIIHRHLNMLFRKYWFPYRYQYRMTRDPFIAWAVVCLMHGYQWAIGRMTWPWYIFTPSFLSWWNYMKTSEEKYLKRYRFWRKMWFNSKKDYVVRLNELREKGIELIQNKNS